MKEHAMFGGREHTSQKGLSATTAVLKRLVEKGYECLVPWGDHRRYDLAFVTTRQGFFKKETQIWRVQCKLARLSSDGGYIVFNTASVIPGERGRRAVKKGYEGDAEYFGVYSPDTGKVYLIFVHQAPNGEMRLRLKKSRNNQEQNVHWAKHYEL